MALVYNDTSSDEQGLVQELRDITGQDALTIQKATRVFNFALDAYSRIAIESSGRWKFDATTHVDADGDRTVPIARATLGAGESSIPLNADQLTIERVTLDGVILLPIDNRDFRDMTPSQIYGTTGTPGYYDYDAGNLVFYPGNDGTERTVEILYSRAAPYFSVDDTTAEVGIPSFHTEFLVLYAAYRLAFRTEDSNRSQLKIDLGDMTAEIKNHYSNRDRTTGRTMRPKNRGNNFAPR